MAAPCRRRKPLFSTFLHSSPAPGMTFILSLVYVNICFHKSTINTGLISPSTYPALCNLTELRWGSERGRSMNNVCQVEIHLKSHGFHSQSERPREVNGLQLTLTVHLPSAHLSLSSFASNSSGLFLLIIGHHRLKNRGQVHLCHKQL